MREQILTTGTSDYTPIHILPVLRSHSVDELKRLSCEHYRDEAKYRLKQSKLKLKEEDRALFDEGESIYSDEWGCSQEGVPFYGDRQNFWESGEATLDASP